MTENQSPIYLDYHATTPVDPRVLEAMLPYLQDRFGNASSHQHAFGWTAEEAVELARRQVAQLIGGGPVEWVFTSGATEAINMALQGAARSCSSRGRHIVTWVTEHKAVLDTVSALQQAGFDISLLPVDREGLVDLDSLERSLRSDTVLVSLLLANNEIGTIQPVEEISRITRQRGIFLHVDAAQAAGKLPVNVDSMQIDLLSLSGHKLCGPKGVGALYIRRRQPRVRLEPILHGGGHERGLRPGTLNVPGIVGLGQACRLAGEEMEAEMVRLRQLRDRLLEGLLQDPGDVLIHGGMQRRLAGNLNLSFSGVASSELLAELPLLAISAGSACTSASPEPSHVIRALGIPEIDARGAVRIGLGRFTTGQEIDRALDYLRSAVKRIRARKSIST